MPAMTLARTLATALCGAWLCVSVQFADAADQVQVIKLRGGEVHLVNNDEKKPKAVINGKEFLFEPKNLSHKQTFNLSDRDILILTSDDGIWRLRVFSLTTAGAVEEIDNFEFRRRDVLDATKKGDAVYFDLGYRAGLKIDAVVSPAGTRISKKAVLRPALEPKTCKWLHEAVLSDCIYYLNENCDFMDMRSMTAFRLNDLDDHPRWAIAGDRFEAACTAACKTKKRPAYSQFAKDICGP